MARYLNQKWSMNEQPSLLQTLSSGDIEAARQRLNNGERLPENLQSYEWSAVFDKIKDHKAFDILDQLIQNGTIETDLYEYDSFKKSIFDHLIRFPTDEASLDYFSTLIGKFQNLNTDLQDQTLLGYALEEGAETALIKRLAEAGCDINYKNNAEENFIYQVVNNGALSVRNKERGVEYMKFLISEGLEVDTANIAGTTPLHLAIDRNRPEYLDVLLENGANPNAQDKKGRTPFYNAVVDQFNLASYDKLARYDSPAFELRAQEEGTMLAKYVSRLDRISETELKLLERLLQDGADVYHTSEHYGKEKSALDWAAEKHAEILKILVEEGNIDINQQDNEGNTLLHKVCAHELYRDNEKAKETYRKVKLLLSKGADIHIQNDKDQTALVLASQDNTKSKTVELLLQN